MYASIRKYRTAQASELSKRVEQGFLPLVQKAPGFVAYYGVDTGLGLWASISIFETEEQADASNDAAADWVKENLGPLISSPEVTAGAVVVSSLPTD